jgi:hypothetical protein
MGQVHQEGDMSKLIQYQNVVFKQVSPAEQELLTFPKQRSSPPFFLWFVMPILLFLVRYLADHCLFRWNPLRSRLISLVWILIVLAHINSSRLDLSLGLDTLSWFRVNQSLNCNVMVTCIFASQGLRSALLISIFETEMSRADRNPWLAKMSYMIQLSNNYNIGYINNSIIYIWFLMFILNVTNCRRIKSSLWSIILNLVLLRGSYV